MPESTPGDVTESDIGEPTDEKLVEIAKYFVYIGIVGFGGPLVHIAMMEDDLAGEDGWTDRQTFMEGLAIVSGSDNEDGPFPANGHRPGLLKSLTARSSLSPKPRSSVPDS